MIREVVDAEIESEGEPDAWREMLKRWQLYTPPGRPSERDIDIFSARLRDRTGGHPHRVLVLGSTPEIRDLLATTPGVQVTIVDFVLDMMTAMTSLMTHPADHETWIRGDWLTAPIPGEYFDTVISDLVLANLPPDAQNRLISRVASLLKPEGRWLNRVDCIDEYTRIRSLTELLAEYEADYGDQSVVCIVRSAAGLVHWDEETSFQDWSALGREMEIALTDAEPGSDREAMLRAVWEITAPFNKPYWLLRKADLEARVAEHFGIAFESVDPVERAAGERGYYIWDLARA